LCGPLAEALLPFFLRIPPTLDQDAALCHAAMQVEPEQPHRGGAFVGERNDLSPRARSTISLRGSPLRRRGVLHAGERGEEVEELKNEADFVAAEAGEVGG